MSRGFIVVLIYFGFAFCFVFIYFFCFSQFLLFIPWEPVAVGVAFAEL